MINNTGAFNPFAWHNRKADIRPYVVYKLKDVDFIVNDTVSSANLVNLATGATTGLTVTVQTYDLDGETLVRSRIQGTLASNTKYYINIDNQIYSDAIEKTSCGIEVEASNLCNDNNYAWSDDAAAVGVNLDMAVQSELLEFESETIQIVTDNGTVEKAKKVRKYYTVEAALPTAFYNMLYAMGTCESVSIGGLPVKNLTVSQEKAADTGYSKVTLKFQFIESENKNSCCEELNLDTISQTGVGGGGGTCTGYSVSISNASGTLTATASGIAGTSIYKWYRNGQYVSTGSSLVTNGVYGEYRVEATNSGCYTASTLYLADPCEAMKITVTVVANEINASIENEISGTTYQVWFNGSQVASSLPYTALASGAYYVYAIKDNCKKVSGVYVELQNEDCDYTASISQNNNELTAVTDASSPTYEWEFENEDGRSAYASTETINMAGDGIYWLTVTSGTCEKEAYHLKQDNKPTIICTLTRQQGHEFNVLEIPLLDITDPATELTVLINGVENSFSPSTPASGGVYSIKSDGKLIIWSGAPLTNGTVKVIWKR